MVVKTNQLVMYKANAAVCPEIRTKQSTQSEHHVEFFNVKPGCTYKKPLGFKRLIQHLVSSLSVSDRPAASVV